MTIKEAREEALRLGFREWLPMGYPIISDKWLPMMQYVGGEEGWVRAWVGVENKLHRLVALSTDGTRYSWFIR